MRRADRKVTDLAQLRDILERCDVCRVALFDEGAPYIVPMNFGWKENGELPILYFHCAAEGKKLSLLSENSACGFELDCSCELVSGEGHRCTMQYECIIGRGKIHIVTDESERSEALRLLMRHYGQTGDIEFPPHVLAITCVLRLDVEEWSGKRNK